MLPDQLITRFVMLLSGYFVIVGVCLCHCSYSIIRHYMDVQHTLVYAHVTSTYTALYTRLYVRCVCCVRCLCLSMLLWLYVVICSYAVMVVCCYMLVWFSLVAGVVYAARMLICSAAYMLVYAYYGWCGMVCWCLWSCCGVVCVSYVMCLQSMLLVLEWLGWSVLCCRWWLCSCWWFALVLMLLLMYLPCGWYVVLLVYVIGVQMICLCSCLVARLWWSVEAFGILKLK